MIDGHVADMDKYRSGSETDSDMDQYGYSGTVRSRNRKQVCHTKSAILARENRARKKAHLQGLEQRCTKLYRDNKALRCTVRSQGDRIRRLHQELSYYKTLLKNSDIITKVADAVANTTKSKLIDRPVQKVKPSFDSMISVDQDTGLPSLFSDYDIPDSDDEWKNSPTASPLAVEGYGVTSARNADHTYTHMPKFEDIPESDQVGVCLHVSNRGMTLEFCPRCSRSRKSSDDGFEEEDDDVGVRLC